MEPRESVDALEREVETAVVSRASDRGYGWRRRWLSEAAKVRGGITAVLVAGRRDAERDLVARMVCREDTAIVEGNAVTFSGSRLAIAGPEEDCDV